MYWLVWTYLCSVLTCMYCILVCSVLTGMDISVCGLLLVCHRGFSNTFINTTFIYL